MTRPALHSWDLPPREAVALQERLRERLVLAPLPARPRLVAGTDCAFAAGGREVVAAVVLLTLPGLETVEVASARLPAVFPYVPGLLSFREAPAVLAAFARLTRTPEAVLVDGQGLLHPRRLGLACHLGLWLDLPTIGVAKSRLVGEPRGPLREQRGSYRTLYHRSEALGRLVRTRDGVNPLWVSPGHRADLPGAMRLTLRCGVGYRLPEPTRRADREVTRLSRGPG